MEEKEHGSPTCYTYDAAGNRIGKKTPEQVTRYSYNGKDQLIEEAWDTGKNIFTYDCQGSILEIAGAEGSRRFTYNSKDQRSRVGCEDCVSSGWTFTGRKGRSAIIWGAGSKRLR